MDMYDHLFEHSQHEVSYIEDLLYIGDIIGDIVKTQVWCCLLNRGTL